MAAAVAVVVFQAEGEEFMFAGETASYFLDQRRVSIVLQYSPVTQKGHFSRLIDVESYSAMQQEAEVAEKRIQETAESVVLRTELAIIYDLTDKACADVGAHLACHHKVDVALEHATAALVDEYLDMACRSFVRLQNLPSTGSHGCALTKGPMQIAGALNPVCASNFSSATAAHFDIESQFE